MQDNSNSDKSVQRDHNTEGITTSHPSVQPISNQEESTSKKLKNLESDPSSSCTPGRPPYRHSSSQPSGAPSCLSLLHKLCVGPATAKKIGGENGVIDENEGSGGGGDMMNVRGGSSSSRSGGRGVRNGVRSGTGGGGGGGGSTSVRSSTGVGAGVGIGMEGLNRSVSCDKDTDKNKIEGKVKQTSSTDARLISDMIIEKNEGIEIRNENEKQKHEQKSDQEKEHEKEDNDEELKEEFLPRNSTSSEQTIEINFSSSSSSTAMQLDFTNESDIIQMTDIKNLSLNLPENHDNSPNSGSTTPIRISDCELSQKIGFIKQLEFVYKLTDMVDKLRSVDRAVRGEILCRGLKKLNERPSELGANSVFL